MPERIDSMDARLRAVEASIIELATMSRMLKLLVFVVAAGLGVDLSGVGLNG